MASNGTISGSGMTASWKVNYQSIESNATSITVNYVIYHDVVSNPTTAYGTISAGGVSKYFSVPIYPGTSTATVGSITAFVYHNTDGTGGARIKGEFNISGVDNGSCNGWVQFETIPRQATILSADNFTDEENPTITYNNPAGDTVGSLRACISFDGETDDIAYREIPINEVAYTFNLTNAEREVLRSKIVGSNTATVYFIIETALGNSLYYSSLAKTLSIVGVEPHLEPIVEDGNEKTYALTKDRNTFVKYFSQAVYYIDASATKGAELVETKVVCGGKSNTSMAGSIDNVESGTFVFSATDNRGNTTTKTLEKPFIEYVKLTCNLVATAPTTEGKATLNISGNYFIGSFGSVSNALSLMYRVKEDDGDWSTWRTTSATPANGTYKTTVNITGLDYQKKWSFQARALDKLMIIDSAVRTVKTTPIFDWGENDFRFNVPVDFAKGFKNYNVLLWQGAYFMTANQTANLASPVQEQANGIVLVFSNYDPTNSQANDYDWHCYFVPKYLVDIKGGTGHCFNMMSQSFGDICSKYIYISDDSLMGHDNNTKSATNNGINYNNAKYVLRYVFGV